MSRNFSKKVSVGDVFGKWTVIGIGNRPSEIKCQCECGQERIIPRWNLLNRNNQSCFACAGDAISDGKVKHGKSKRGKIAREYVAWSAMHRRCTLPSQDRYEQYGGRGITVCERWNSFENFFADMGECPSPEHSIGRKDNDGNYEPSNCRWETDEQQRNNKSNNRFMEYQGERLSYAQWSRRLGIPSWKIGRQKKRGWSDVDIVEGRAIGPKPK